MLVDRGDLPTAQTVPFPFPAYDAAGASVTISGLAVTDIEVFKGTSMTQRTSDNGYALLDTDGIDIDSRTGIHGFSIDFADDSDAGFYAAGNFYWVVVDAITVDSQTVRFIFTFSLGFNLRPTTAGRTLDVSSGGEAGVDWANVGSPTTAVNLSGTTTNLVNTVTTYTGNTPQTGDSFARIGANGASLTSLATAAELAKVPKSDGSETWNATALASIRQEVESELTDNGLDHLFKNAVVGADVTDNTVIARLVSKSATADWDSFVHTTDSLQAIRDNMGSAQSGDAFAELASGTYGLSALKTLIDAIDTVVDAILADTGTDGVVLSATTANAIADALLDRTAGVETNRTPRQALRLMLAALVGKASGMATTTATIRDTNDSVNRIVATVDADGNRSAVTLNAG